MNNDSEAAKHGIYHIIVGEEIWPQNYQFY